MKYMGSKSRIALDILRIILKSRSANTLYVEPFCGGCNVIDRVRGLRHANDINPYLIEMFKALLNGWRPNKFYLKEQYIDIRTNKDRYPPHLVGYVGFNCSYSGKWFGGYAGIVKTKTGLVRNYQDEAYRHILKQVKRLQGTTFSSLSYDQLDIPDGSIVYCDPPYKYVEPYLDYNFNSDIFWAWARELSKRCKVYISEYEAPDDFECLAEFTISSSLSNNGEWGNSFASIERLFRLNQT